MFTDTVLVNAAVIGAHCRALAWQLISLCHLSLQTPPPPPLLLLECVLWMASTYKLCRVSCNDRVHTVTVECTANWCICWRTDSIRTERQRIAIVRAIHCRLMCAQRRLLNRRGCAWTRRHATTMTTSTCRTLSVTASQPASQQHYYSLD